MIEILLLYEILMNLARFHRKAPVAAGTGPGLIGSEFPQQMRVEPRHLNADTVLLAKEPPVKSERGSRDRRL